MKTDKKRLDDMIELANLIHHSPAGQTEQGRMTISRLLMRAELLRLGSTHIKAPTLHRVRREADSIGKALKQAHAERMVREALKRV